MLNRCSGGLSLYVRDTKKPSSGVQLQCILLGTSRLQSAALAELYRSVTGRPERMVLKEYPDVLLAGEKRIAVGILDLKLKYGILRLREGIKFLEVCASFKQVPLCSLPVAQALIPLKIWM